MNSVFYEYHPVINFAYFAVVLVFTMFVNNPVILAISFFTAFIYSIYLNGIRMIKFYLKTGLPVFLLIAIINPLFNHGGVTIISYFPDGNPFTLESLIYGIVSAFLISAVMLWFSCINKIMISDKIIYLFGKITPKLGLLISMILRFIPKFKTQFQLVRNAQRCIGKDITNGKPLQRIRNAVRIFSIMILWSMENSIQTADSMKSRGYGLPHRTSYSPYRFVKRDSAFLAVMFLFVLFILIGVIKGITEFYYFPLISAINTNIYSISIYSAYFIICIMPFILDIKEAGKWKYIQSKI